VNFLGMGSVEIVVVLLVAFIVLGPKRMTEAARMLGKATREVRRMTESLPQMILDEEEPSQVPEWRRTVAGPSSPIPAPSEPGAPADGPVEFKSGAEPELPVSTDENGVDVPGPAAPADGAVAFEAGAGPAMPASSVEESGGDEPEGDAPPKRETK
jgi:Sec-independent protein translocase protein TatA